jgi:hypothetical protein
MSFNLQLELYGFKFVAILKFYSILEGYFREGI